jgi:hypothetical protein
MEVHHHAHDPAAPHHHKKNWKNYFWEFLMLFLAVFCGFLAEYQLEHLIEVQREKKFIASYIEDLKSDTAFISDYINRKQQKIADNDSLIYYLNATDPNANGQRIYFYARQLTRRYNFFPSDGTIKQLKNSGGFRLIRKQQVSDSISSYDKSVENILLTQNIQTSELAEVRPLIGKLLDPNVLESMIKEDAIVAPIGNPRLRNSNKEFILDFIYLVHQLKGSDILNSRRLKQLQLKATKIILFLKKEYQLP